MAQDPINKLFARALLSFLVEEMKAIVPKIKTRKDAYVMRSTGDQWFFETTPREGAVEKFSVDMNAYNAVEARCMGWQAYLRKFHAEAWNAEHPED